MKIMETIQRLAISLSLSNLMHTIWEKQKGTTDTSDIPNQENRPKASKVDRYPNGPHGCNKSQENARRVLQIQNRREGALRRSLKEWSRGVIYV